MTRIDKFFIGQRIVFLDKHNLAILPRKGTIVGSDSCPPSKTKRSGDCYVIKPDDNDLWEIREAEEISPEPKEWVKP